MKKRRYPLSAQQRLRSDWVDAQADGLSLRKAHMSFCWFCHAAAQIMSSRCRRSNRIVLKSRVAGVVLTPCGLRIDDGGYSVQYTHIGTFGHRGKENYYYERLKKNVTTLVYSVHSALKLGY